MQLDFCKESKVEPSAMSSFWSAYSENDHFFSREYLLEAPEILWTWLATLPGLTTGSMRPVWMIEQLMRQNASEMPAKEPRDRRKSEDLLTNMMVLEMKVIEFQEKNVMSPACWKE